MNGKCLSAALLLYIALMVWVAHNALDGATNYTIIVIATSSLVVCIGAYNVFRAAGETRQRVLLRGRQAQARRRHEACLAAQRRQAENQRLDEDSRML